MAGLVPAISLRMAMPCVPKRDARDKRGHDKKLTLPLRRATSPCGRGEETAWRGNAHGAAGPTFLYQSAIWLPVQNSTSFFFLIFWKIWRKYFARCGAPMM